MVVYTSVSQTAGRAPLLILDTSYIITFVNSLTKSKEINVHFYVHGTVHR